MSLLFSCCSSADNSRLFLPLCDMRSQAAIRSKFFSNIVMAAVSAEAHHVPFPAA
jgi:hypothetical protein